MNGFAVDPGSNGSVSAVAARLRADPSRRLAIARISPSVRIENDDVAALGAHSRDGVGQRLFGDLLQIGVDREDDAVSLRRRRARLVGDSRLCPFGVPDDRRRARNAAQDGIERQLEPVDRLVVRVDVADDPLRALRHRIRARRSSRTIARRAAPSPARRPRRGSGREPSDTSSDVSSARANQRRLDVAAWPARDAACAGSLHFARRDLQAHHLAALREDPACRVENLAARRGHLALARLLALGARRATPSRHQLDAAPP